ncbi:hypothetical protein GOBAR_AA03572 [Gossypium barbadense]|uniref:Uncharacterized protein n=1 Tax=Gossypium barbadense TaxID=3634 RepID=A0A2P5YN40_GOSBA|nr:hypothetical protein GOBAR_AA03572 [Gossypium barbadense]
MKLTYRGDSRKVAEAFGAVAKNQTWPHRIYNTINSDELGQNLTGLREEPANYFYNYCGINPFPWMVVSLRVERVALINLLTTLINVKVVGGAGTDQAFESYSKETFGTSEEMEDVLGLRSRLHAVHKKRRTRTGATNVAVSSKEKTTSGRLEYYQKMREDPIRASTMVIASTASPTNSSSRVSSLIIAIDNPSLHALFCATTPLPSIEEFVSKDDSELFSAHRYLNVRELYAVIEGYEVLVPKTVKECMRHTESSSGHEVPLLTQLISTLRNLLTEATTISLGVRENTIGAEAHYKELVASCERERKRFLEMGGRIRYSTNRVTRDFIIIEHKDIMARCEQKHAEDLEGLKKSSIETMLSLLTEVKFNILLYTQVAAGPFDARHIDFDALYEIEMDNLGFDVCCLLGIASEEFIPKWRGLWTFTLRVVLVRQVLWLLAI